MAGRRSPWIVFAAAVAIVLGVMGFVTVKLVELDRDRAQTERRATLEEQVRLALWRMDSTVIPILSQEVAEVGVLCEAGSFEPATAVLPTHVLARFHISQDGEIAFLSPVTAELAAALRETLGDAQMFARLENPGTPTLVVEQQVVPEYFSQEGQKLKSRSEWNARKSKVADNIAQYQVTVANSLRYDGKAPALASGATEPVWLGDRLLVARMVRTPTAARVEGSVLDWTSLRTTLRAEVRDLLPQADVLPVLVTDADTERMLATLPARLDPGPAAVVPSELWSPLRASLAVGWIFVLLATGAVFALQRSSLALSERRAAFVSAVTHELRTPLTTFRMYAEMLEDKMVEAKRAKYLATLRREADRLGHLVENVLSYSRIESDRRARPPDTLAALGLLERVRTRLDERCTTAGLTLELDHDADAETLVRVDPSAVEQILFNLVDNAAKYAPSERDPKVRVWLRARPDAVEIGVRDFGPGIPAGESERIFEPFAKGEAHTAGTKPGVGLGLALSRELARQMGGDLTLRAADPGAEFVLTLRRATAA